MEQNRKPTNKLILPRINNGERTVSSTRKLDTHIQKNKIVWPLSYTRHKNELTRTKDVNILVRPETIKLQEENNRTLLWHSSWQWFLVCDTKSTSTKTKIDKWDYIKSESVCIAKEVTNRVQRQPMEWEKTFANNICDKGIIFLGIFRRKK